MPQSHPLIRHLHLATPPALGAFAYASPLRETLAFVAIVQWGAVPRVAGAGLWMWIRPWLTRRAAQTPRS